MRLIVALFLCAMFSSLPVSAQAPAGKTLKIYLIDVEGGDSTLLVSPSGESILFDTGWPGFNGRDADRIAAAAKDAGIKQIDHLVITHFHSDHVGGVPQLLDRLPVKQYIDHGTTVQTGDDGNGYLPYAAIRDKANHMLAKPGEKIPISGVDAEIVAAGGEVLDTNLPGGGKPNPYCADFKPQEGAVIEQEKGFRAEDPMSVSTFITYGKFRTEVMGDLTWNKEPLLMCPNNRLGTVDLYIVSHHGSATSGSPALVYALHPRVAVMNNGPRKGGDVQTFQILSKSPGLEDLWQNHVSVAGGTENNMQEKFIANLDEGPPMVVNPGRPAVPVHMGPSNFIKISAQSDGTFTVTNTRNNFSKTYPPKP